MKRKGRFWIVAMTLTLLASGQHVGAELQETAFAYAKVVLVAQQANAPEPEKKAAEILRKRILKRCNVSVEISTSETQGAKSDVVLVLGTPEGNPEVGRLMSAFGVQLPTLPNSKEIHPESYLIASGVVDGQKFVVLAGSEPRSVAYAVGGVLRAATYEPERFVLPALNRAEKPAFNLRGGTPTGPGSRAKEFGNLRPQTAEEATDRMEDLVLLGANTIGGELEVVRSYGMQSYFGRKANEPGGEFPKEWGADDGRSTRYVCPSIPEARKALLESFDKWFSEVPFQEIYAIKSGDPGGCRCDRCEPWGATYIKLVHEIADILHKYHPDTKVIATNQDLSNEGNLAIFEYLNTHGSEWLYALRYGPGADEMQEYIRGPVNPVWFEYEGFGPLGNYLKYMHHELPRETTIVGFTDVTHWMQAQYAVEQPDIALAAVYDRRSWNARPRAFHRAASEIFHYMDGDLYYSEGQHDDFNKWFWQRMLWNPHLSAVSITSEYCRYHFGPAAQDEMVEAIFLMEETMDKAVIGNPGIARTVDLLRSAGEEIPENILRNDHRWRVFMQRALVDRYIQLALERGQDMKDAAGAHLKEARAADDPRTHVEAALAALQSDLETEEMRALLKEAEQRGAEANDAVGYREPAPYLVKQFDFTETQWWKKSLEDALGNSDPAHLRNAAGMILKYSDPGEGGFYDDLGWPARSPHLIEGQTLWSFSPFSGPAKMSYYGSAYAYGSADRGVRLAYESLDPNAAYVVRLGVKGRGSRGAGAKEIVQADATALGEPFEIPADKADLLEFAIPRELTQDGRVEIAITPASEGQGVVTVSEIWLMREDKMPWSAKN